MAKLTASCLTDMEGLNKITEIVDGLRERCYWIQKGALELLTLPRITLA